MGNAMLKLVKLVCIGSGLYSMGKACKLYGYIKGFCDFSEFIFDAVDMENEEEKRNVLMRHATIVGEYKDLKNIMKDLKDVVNNK